MWPHSPPRWHRQRRGRPETAVGVSRGDGSGGHGSVVEQRIVEKAAELATTIHDVRTLNRGSGWNRRASDPSNGQSAEDMPEAQIITPVLARPSCHRQAALQLCSHTAKNFCTQHISSWQARTSVVLETQCPSTGFGGCKVQGDEEACNAVPLAGPDSKGEPDAVPETLRISDGGSPRSQMCRRRHKRLVEPWNTE